MFTLKDFKSVAVMSHDNTKAAQTAWSKTWGYDWWRSLWQYKEYTATTASGRKFIYRTGKVYTRHTNYSHTEFLVDSEEVSRAKFLKVLDEVTANEPLIGKPAETPKPVVVKVRQPRVIQLSLF